MFAKLDYFAKVKPNLLVFILGLLTVLATSPFYLFFLYFLIFPPLLTRLYLSRSYKNVIKLGFYFGLGFSLSNFYWVSFSFLVRGDVLAWLFPLAFILIPIYFSVYYLLQFLLISYIRNYFKLKRWSFYFLFAFIWVLFEYIRSNFLYLVSFNGFPWGLLGYNILFSEFLAQFAFYITIYGLSLVILLTSSLFFCFYSKQKKTKKYLLCFVINFVFYAGFHFFGKIIYTQEDMSADHELDFAIIHPNFKDHHGFDHTKIQSNIEFLQKLSLQKQSDLLIWPEGSVPYPIVNDTENQDLIEYIHPKILADSLLIFGGVRVEEEKYFNSLFVINSKREIEAYYDKEILVPFGEYLPYQNFLSFLPIVSNLGSFSPGSSQNLLTLEDYKFAILICYDALFPNVVTKNSEADYIINISNDIWFIADIFGLNLSIAPYQHLDMIKMRAIESRKPIIRATNLGISAIIMPNGQIKSSLTFDKAGVI